MTTIKVGDMTINRLGKGDKVRRIAQARGAAAAKLELTPGELAALT